MSTTKQLKATAIAQCVQLIAIHYQVEPAKIVSPDNRSRLAAVLDARKVLCYHLRHCGMSHEQIGRIVHRSVEKVQDMVREGQFRYLSDRHKPLMDRLPRIPLTLNISNA